MTKLKEIKPNFAPTIISADPPGSDGGGGKGGGGNGENDNSGGVRGGISWIMPLAIAFGLAATTITSGWFFYGRMSNWLIRGKEIGENLKALEQGEGNLTDCFDKQFEDVIVLLNSGYSSSSVATSAADKEATNAELGDQSESSQLSGFEDVAVNKIDLFLNRLRLYEKRSLLIAQRAKVSGEAESADVQTGINKEIEQVDRDIKEIELTLKGLGIPKISIPEFLRINNQMDLIQKRIYTHFNVVRLYYTISTAFAISASVSLLGGSILLFLITKDGWKDVSQNRKYMAHSLFICAGFYVFFLNLPAVLSAERIYESNLAQYVGYTNLEGEICTVLATERFFGTPENPEVITEVEFNRLIHSVEREMRKLNTHNLSPNFSAIEGFVFDLDSLEIPRKEEVTQ
jgi:hypothetical protein